MDRIQAALERFRSQVPKVPFSKSPNPSGRPTAPDQIIYTQTKSVSVPLSILREHNVVAAFQDGPFLESFKILRTQVMQRLRENNWNVLSVTSPGPQEGKTLTAVNMAISIAMDFTNTVLLVDGNLRRPHLHKVFGLEDGLGLTDYLLDDIGLESCLVHPGIDRLVILPGGRPIQASCEALTSPKMGDLVEELKDRYPSRIVIFDLPSLHESADALAFVPSTDAVLLIVEEGKTTTDDLGGALQYLKGAAPVIGSVLNKMNRLTLSTAAAKELLSPSMLVPDSGDKQTNVPQPSQSGLSLIKGLRKKNL